jgi:hypothetical protein
MTDALRQHLARVTLAADGTTIDFPVTDFDSSWGHDSAKRKGLGRKGVDIQTVGQREKSIKFHAALFNDFPGWPSNLFPDVFERLVELLEQNPFVTLTHPTRGNLLVHVDDVGEPIDEKKRNGVYVPLAFTEQGDPAEIYLFRDPTSAADPATRVESQAAAADAAAEDLDEDGRPEPVAEEVAAALEYLEGGDRSYLEIASSIRDLLALISLRLALPSVAGIAGHAYRVALEALRAAVLDYRTSYLGEKQPTRYVVPKTMSLWQIAGQREVYNDPRKAYLLRLSNEIPDPSFVPAGSVLVVLPSLDR